MPSITQNLISVSKFAQDNGVVFEFHPNHHVVKSQVINEVLLQGSLCLDGLHVFPDLHLEISIVATLIKNDY